jgi:uncharacterized phage protein (TIGR02218 family)
MKKIVEGLVDREVLTTCRLWEIIRSDGMRLGFTNFDRSLLVDNLVYHANPGLTAAATSSNNSLESPSNTELTTVFSSDLITMPDLLAGKYDYAKLRIYLVNYLDTSQKMLLTAGYVGETKNSEIDFIAEFRSLSQRLDQQIAELTSPECRAEFCDPDCGLSIATYTHTETITQVASNSNFNISGTWNDDRFTKGHLRFTYGDNEGFRSNISLHGNNTITIFEPTPYQIAIGDAVTLVEGCDKKKQTCIDRFHNYLNFQGEAELPGMDEYYRGYNG